MARPHVFRKVPLRSPSEIRFRLFQELENLHFFALPPRLPAATLEQTQSPCPILPNPAKIVDRLKATSFAAECVRIADDILRHRFPLLGMTLETGTEIRWRKDYTSGVESPAAYFRRIPYLDATRAGDHKAIWEINRHQHLVLLAQAHLFSGRRDFLDEIPRQLESWFEQNPFQRGINWTSALEIAFRALSWIWVFHFVGDRLNPAFRRQFLEGLYHHGLHLEANLSYYFSPNTHLLGEAVALHALGALFPHFPRAARWQQTGARVVRNEIDRQVRLDGSHFEQSTYYHVYALDMFLFHAILRPPDDVYRDTIRRMGAFLDTIMGACGVLPFFGDDDGGRLFHPYGARDRFGLATLATCGAFLSEPEWIRDSRHLGEQSAWWMSSTSVARATPESPSSGSIRFADSGLTVMSAGDIQLIADAGPFGPGSAGHSHADTLSLVLRQRDEQILVDPGTYTYVTDPIWRDRFRGTAAHTTVRIDGMDQAIPAGPFAWRSRPEVEVLHWESAPEQDLLIAACSYAGFRHQRSIVFDKSSLLIAVVDHVEGGPGEHRVEQFWHFGAEARVSLITFDEEAEPRLFTGDEYGWISPAPGAKSAAPVVCVEKRGRLPITFATLINLSGKAIETKEALRKLAGQSDSKAKRLS